MEMKENIRKIITIVAGVLFAVITVFNSFYTISEQEAAVVTTFGMPRAVTETGLHFKIPYVQEVTKVNTTINGLMMGYRINEAGVEEANESESLMITQDYNFVNVDFYIEYRIVDPVKYLYASEDPVNILKNISQSWIRDTIGSYDVDAVLTTGKGEIQSVIKERIIGELEQMDIGIQLVNITIQDAEPPTDAVMIAFKAVETAKQGMETTINEANQYMNEQIPLALAEVDRILQEAEVIRTQRINQGYEEVAMFNAMYEEYLENPEVTRLRMFYETMENILPDMKIVINNSDGTVETLYPLETFAQYGITGTGGTGNITIGTMGESEGDGDE
ncbi:MAG: FtsH protease activity modulator HflK [Lachnospiraceae bacterium]|nr:FtsH protease activity modulator HflK [Lachnospiraceae bacterium]